MRSGDDEKFSQDLSSPIESSALAAGFLRSIGIVPKAFIGYGTASRSEAVVFSFGVDAATRSIRTGKVFLSSGGIEYESSQENDPHATVMETVASMVCDEFSEELGKDSMLVLPAMYERKTRELKL